MRGDAHAVALADQAPPNANEWLHIATCSHDLHACSIDEW
jgi:hypothetical protein